MVNVKELPIDEIIPYENNPRINGNAVENVANSIKEFGFKNPIVLDENNIIIAGHTRLLAARKNGLLKVPCIIVNDLTEKQVKAFRIADNKTQEFSKWDMEILMQELLFLKESDYDIKITGFDDDFFKNNESLELEEIDEIKKQEKQSCHCPKCGFVFEV